MDYVWAFSLILLMDMSVSIPILNCFYYYNTVVQLVIGDGDNSSSSTIIQTCLNYPGIFVFLYEAEDYTFKMCEELHWNFHGDFIDSPCLW